MDLATDVNELLTRCVPVVLPKPSLSPTTKKCTPRNGAGTLHDPLHYKASHSSSAAGDAILLLA